RASTIGELRAAVAAAADRLRSNPDISQGSAGRARQAGDRLASGIACLLDDLLLPTVVVGVERVAQLPLDLPAQRLGRFRMVLEPLVRTQRIHHLEQSLSAVFERDAGVFGLRAFLVSREPHQ